MLTGARAGDAGAGALVVARRESSRASPASRGPVRRALRGPSYDYAMQSRSYPRYRLLTGSDDDAFCYRVSEALDLGYVLHGGPAITASSESVYVAQALVWPEAEPPPARPE